MKEEAIKRIRVISVLFLLFVCILVIRLYFVQVFHGQFYLDQADHQYVRPNQSLFDRGSIFFEDKAGNLISAAGLKDGFLLAINPNILENPEEVYEKLSGIIELDENEFIKKVSSKEDPYEEIMHKLPENIASKIESLEIDGVQIYRERWRFYPGENLSAQTIGFVGFRGDDLVGRYGVERYYDDILNKSEQYTSINFFAEVFSNFSSDNSIKNLLKGDVVLTIEPVVQSFLEEELQKTHSNWGSKLSGAVIINPQNGEIKALAVNPSFDLNTFFEVEDQSKYLNPIVESVYEMGSIIKPITMASGLDTGAVTANTTYNDKGFLVLDEYKISNYDGKGRGVVSMQEVLNQSLNTGVSFVVSQMGNKEFAKHFERFGLMEETGIDLPGEINSLTDNLKSPRNIEYATASFGQGIALTPIMTVRALSALGNGGKLITPHVVKRINYDSGVSKEVFFDAAEEQVISKETSDEITRMLVKVVDDALLGGTVKLEHYSVAAKTGTAQIADTRNGGYYDDRFLHSFFGYFPAYNPEFLIFLFMLEPKDARFASQTLTYPFIDTVNFLINYYEIVPDR